jgi:hypothetical protein
MYHGLFHSRTSPSKSGAHTARWIVSSFFLLVVAASLFFPAARAQFRASIQGSVTGAGGAVIPAATPTLTDLGTAKGAYHQQQYGWTLQLQRFAT